MQATARNEPRHDPRQAVRYPGNSGLQTALNHRVAAFFESRGIERTGGPRLWGKTATILLWLAASWALLVFWASTPLQVGVLVFSLALAVSAVGFNIQHDGGHLAYGKPLANRLSALALDLIGGSSYVWSHKHTLIHHHFTNIDGVDEDIEARPWLRMAPSQPRHAFHRFQHVYGWLLYGFLAPKWHFVDDFVTITVGRVGSQPIPRPRGLDLALLFLGKTVFFGWAFVIPLLAGHSLLAVALTYLACSALIGIILSVVFQLAHCVDEAHFAQIPEDAQKMDRPWAEHQLATTVDFAPRNRLLTWFVGGLNFQVEHHLFPRISHVHYPAIQPIVREVCREHGVEHHVHDTFRAAVRSHGRFLRRLGQS